MRIRIATPAEAKTIKRAWLAGTSAASAASPGGPESGRRGAAAADANARARRTKTTSDGMLYTRALKSAGVPEVLAEPPQDVGFAGVDETQLEHPVEVGHGSPQDLSDLA
jgi:hypothetical protein